MSIMLKSYSYLTPKPKYKILPYTKENRMDAHNLAIVFSPNIVYSVTTGIRPEQILLYMEWNNLLVEQLLNNVNIIFEK